ncbi:DUF3800 domain-containing protein [Arcanobacterium phocisimile]|uniref:DUF3800 domain-containing protein n=1 Tax=Arcanobacterium phocisimile TaxID=1302235 RepID=A0ABX7IGA4_9ACTO|nr:DUF3800 domain-containing protein [Arcanobacterium phocisimile]QRV02151.1 DUF3800 domain-containing protein [Arcanobacterium phocisimile]
MPSLSQIPSRTLKTATFFIDESESKSSAGKFFVIGLAKTYLPWKLSWEMRHIRERHSFKDEFKFAKVKTILYQFTSSLSMLPIRRKLYSEHSFSILEHLISSGIVRLGLSKHS